MNKSQSIKSLSEALAKAQAEVKNPRFDAVNPHFKSKFASLGAVREVVIPAFTRHGLSISQWPVSNDGHAGCVTHLSHSSGEWIEEVFLIPVDKHNAHGYASAVTYSKRIAMQSVAGVVGDEDDDANAAVGENAEGKRQEGNSPTQFARECLEGLPLKHQEHIREMSLNVIAMLDEDRDTDAYLYVEEQKLDDVEKPALWSLLDSKQRARIKTASESFRGAKKLSREEYKGKQERASA